MEALAGLRVLEFASIGPCPMAAMMLSDFGAEVTTVERVTEHDLGLALAPQYDTTRRGRRSIAIDLKQEKAIEIMKKLAANSDVIIEGFRPGVMEKLGLGPEACLEINPRLIYARMTGFGQSGPLAQVPGHDINFIALAGALHTIGVKNGQPVPPFNYVGDMGGGAFYLLFGILSALYERSNSGFGQVVDAAIVDGTASMMTPLYGLTAAGIWRDERGVNTSDTGSHFYNTYRTSDNKWVAIGAGEQRFHDRLLEILDIDIPKGGRFDRETWEPLKDQLKQIFSTRTRDEWCDLLMDEAVCFTPVLSIEEAPLHPQNQLRGTFIEIDGVVQPAPHPKLSRTPGKVHDAPVTPGAHSSSILAELDYSDSEIAELISANVVSE